MTWHRICPTTDLCRSHNWPFGWHPVDLPIENWGQNLERYHGSLSSEAHHWSHVSALLAWSFSPYPMDASSLQPRVEPHLQHRQLPNDSLVSQDLTPSFENSSVNKASHGRFAPDQKPFLSDQGNWFFHQLIHTFNQIDHDWSPYLFHSQAKFLNNTQAQI